MEKVLTINKDIIPYYFNIVFADEAYEMRIDYNGTADLFTVSLAKNDNILCYGEPIIYGKPLFGDLVNRGQFPLVTITPLDTSGEYNAVTYDNLSNTVLLYVSDGVIYE